MMPIAETSDHFPEKVIFAPGTSTGALSRGDRAKVPPSQVSNVPEEPIIKVEGGASARLRLRPRILALSEIILGHSMTSVLRSCQAR